MGSASASFPKLVVSVVILPLVLAVAGGWQLMRAGGGSELLDELDGVIKAVERVQEEAGDPDVILRTLDGEKIRATAILPGARDFRKLVAEKVRWQRTFCRPLAVAVIFFGLAGAGMGGYGLYTVRGAGRKALHSRDALVWGFQDGLGKLPWLIGAIGLFIALGIAAGGAFELAYFVSDGVWGRGAAKLLLFGAAGIGALFFFGGKLVRNIYRTSKAVFEWAPLRLMGKSITREEAPLVWNFVGSVARGAGTAMPDAIILGLDEGFFVTEHPVALVSGEAVPPGRILHMPLPYMAYMTKPEAVAVIGHELGHFTGADTEYSLRFSPIYATAVNNLRAVDAAADINSGLVGLVAKPAMMFGLYFLDSFDCAVQHWSREREFAADRTSAGIAGNEATALSLLRLSVLSLHVDQALDECWGKGGNVAGGVVGRVRELVRENGLGNPEEHLEETQAHPTDSHPATRQRLEALGVSVTPDLLARARSGEESPLLRELGLEEAEAALSASGGNRLRADLEAEFSLAAREAVGMCDMEEVAGWGTDSAVFHEDPQWRVGGLAIGVGMFLLGVFAAQRSVLAGIGGMGMGILGVWMLFSFGKRKTKPFMTMTGDGFSVGTTEQEIPWTAVADYGLSSFVSTIQLEIDFTDGYEPPEIRGDRRVKYKPEKRLLLVMVRDIAKPQTLESFVGEFHAHWQGGVARAYLAEHRAENAD